MSCPLQVELIMDTGPAVKKLYQQIARQIAAAIAGGRYAPGDKLHNEMAVHVCFDDVDGDAL